MELRADGVALAFGTDIALRTAAAGARAARIISDAAAETAGNLAAPSSATSRVRFVLESTRPFDLGEGGILTPTVRFGERRDVSGHSGPFAASLVSAAAGRGRGRGRT